MTTGTTPAAYSSTYGHIVTVALTQGWSVSHRDFAPGRSQLTAQRGNDTLAFTFDSRFSDDGVYCLADITLTQLTPDETGYTERPWSISLIDALEVLEA